MIDPLIGKAVPVQATTGYDVIRGVQEGGRPILAIAFRTKKGDTPYYEIPLECVPEVIDQLRKCHGGAGHN